MVDFIEPHDISWVEIWFRVRLNISQVGETLNLFLQIPHFKLTFLLLQGPEIHGAGGLRGFLKSGARTSQVQRPRRPEIHGVLGLGLKKEKAPEGPDSFREW